VLAKIRRSRPALRTSVPPWRRPPPRRRSS